MKTTCPYLATHAILTVTEYFSNKRSKKILVFMHRVKICSDVPSIFANKFSHSSPRYPTNFSNNNFALPKYLSHKSKYKISIRDLSLWNKALSNAEKELRETSLFKTKSKSKLLKIDGEVKYFRMI